ncbi:MAG: hypothetical protein IKI04_01620, partial [Bacilli bacterium]|nr:hypothetical protein [Bacilli bacterium]
LLLIFLSIPTVFAHELYGNGWHLVVANNESERGKSWVNQNKVWGYYEGGREIRRYSVLLGAHRGWGTAPENSLAAFRLAKQNGYDAFETDVRFTSDNVAVLCHDVYINDVARNNDLSEITDKVYVRNVTYQELKDNYVFNIERVNHGGTATTLDSYNNNRITRFDEMLDFVKQNKMLVAIELKVGTEAQIRSLVKMTQDRGMHNNVIWISFSSNLLKFVRDYDDDEVLMLLTSDTCEYVPNSYCGDNNEYYINKLRTDNNVLLFDNVGTPLSWNINLPSKSGSYPPSKYQITAIPQGKLTLTSGVTISPKGKKSVDYIYDGDGLVKCVSADTSILTCSVDTTNKKINLTSLNSTKGNTTVTIYATSGISYSATGDVKLSVTIGDEPTRGSSSSTNTTTNTTTDNTTNNDTSTPKKYKKGDWHHNIDVNPPTSSVMAIVFSLVAIITIITSFVIISNYKEKEN